MRDERQKGDEGERAASESMRLGELLVRQSRDQMGTDSPFSPTAIRLVVETSGSMIENVYRSNLRFEVGQG